MDSTLLLELSSQNNPDGISIEITVNSFEFIYRTRSEDNHSSGRFKPVPNKASITTEPEFKVGKSFFDLI